MSPAIYQEHKPNPNDTYEDKRKKIYLAVMSCEEQAYTLGAAIGECRKQLTNLDNQVREIKTMFEDLKHLCPLCGCKMKDGICQNYGCEHDRLET